MTLRVLSCNKKTWGCYRISRGAPFLTNEKRLPGGRSRTTKNYYGEGPVGTYDNSTGVFTESGCWTNAADGQPSDDERTGGKERPDEDPNDGVQGHRASKRKVSHIALQTDTCDMLYITKNTQRLPVLVTNKFLSWCQTNKCNNCIYLSRYLPTKKQIEKLKRFVDRVNITG